MLDALSPSLGGPSPFLGSCGKILSGCKNLLYQQNTDGIGEVCIWGRHVFMGYLEKEQETMEVIDEDGWLHTGDLGHMDSQGYLFISGRIKGTGTVHCRPPASRRADAQAPGTRARAQAPASGPGARPGGAATLVRAAWLVLGPGIRPSAGRVGEASHPNPDTRFLPRTPRTTVCRSHG